MPEQLNLRSFCECPQPLFQERVLKHACILFIGPPFDGLFCMDGTLSKHPKLVRYAHGLRNGHSFLTETLPFSSMPRVGMQLATTVNREIFVVEIFSRLSQNGTIFLRGSIQQQTIITTNNCGTIDSMRSSYDKLL